MFFEASVFGFQMLSVSNRVRLHIIDVVVIFRVLSLDTCQSFGIEFIRFEFVPNFDVDGSGGSKDRRVLFQEAIAAQAAERAHELQHLRGQVDQPLIH